MEPRNGDGFENDNTRLLPLTNASPAIGTYFGPFAKWRGIVLRMARLKRDSKAMLRTMARSEERSPLFWWMVDDHDSILALTKGKRIHWPAVCAEATRRGKTDTEGNAPSLANAKKTWQRARKYVAETRAANAAKLPPPVHPSRISKDWRPPNAPPPPGQAQTTATAIRASVLPANNFMPVRTNEPQEIEPYDPSKEMDRLRRVIAERSGKKWRE